ncbi:D-alanyl-D-alanine carboxypeptidase [Peteryoungia aggregata LMG 23059]|uniref:D-alanyl-D-alanine carboxypeptidase n=1 Tax=Peteryoungia aggregata LMG 23059 TaxID=1368425 RepID=A0ABU0G757_9HYPH|nr:D-alanyl-D-alanine carboxypeptidase [Peteryoungia aggregata]MDQ0421174.1 D-alanyl-D-alanine carboxypeptidase [Peteryoungia aggregata LMG 23059]
MHTVLGSFNFAVSFRRIVLAVFAAIVTSVAAVSAAQANPKYAGIVIDAKTGKVLYSENADSLRYPASLTKMMTLYMVFEALESGKVSLNSKVPFSANAAKEPPSKLGVGTGRSITVEQAILSLVTRSANDSATAIAEYLGGSEQRFAQMMTAKARSLGMTKTTYRNAHGLPNTAQMTTARDQARLSIALRQHFPQYYGYFSTRSFRFGKQTIGNHNRLLGQVRGVDGIKTGYTRAAGYNLATSAEAGGRSIVAVVLGATSGARRNAQMTSLVQRYLPAASATRGGNTIAKNDTSIAPAQATASVGDAMPTLPQTGPMPDPRYNGVAQAYAAAPTTNGASAALETLRPVAPAAASGNAVPVPQPAPAYMPDSGAAVLPEDTTQSVAAASATPPDVDQLTTASTTPASGWVVQIGTSPDKELAMDLLRDAQEKGGKVLRSATPFTVAYGDGAQQIYRARFGGFDEQKDAINACKALKKKGIGCWASAQ